MAPLSDPSRVQTASTPSALDIALFGPLQVRVDGQALPRLPSRKSQYLLAWLTLRHDRSIERAWLAGLLWPESAESQALFNLRQCLSHLRQVLGPAASRLLSPTPYTLCLDLAGATADVVTFDQAIGRGDAISLQQAVALYRGALLEGCLEEWVLPERQAREQAYVLTLERLAQQALQAADPGRAVGYWRQMIATDPLRESAQRGLLAALAASGDYAAAVQVYRELRLLLRKELNAEPAAETRALFEQVCEQARTQVPLRSRAEVTASQELPPRRSSGTWPTNLTVPLTSFIGRETEIQEVKQLLGQSRLLTLTGTGGYGKTRLALQVAEQVIDTYPDGVWLVELAALSDPNLLPQNVASALGLREAPGRSLTDTLIEALKPKTLLLLLDNCEHLVGACASLAETLLKTCPSLKILATSREALQVVGEQPWRVPPMTHPTREHLASAEKELASSLLDYDACRLFAERARLQQPEFRLTPYNALAVAQLCERLDGMPLALELAASRLRVLSLEQVCQRLSDRFRLLRGGSRTAPSRHQTLKATIDWSYDLLEPQEQLLLCRLSVFAGGWTLSAAEFVCSADEGVQVFRYSGVQEKPLPTLGNEVQPRAESNANEPKYLNTRRPEHLNTDEVLDLLTSLVDKSLVAFEQGREGDGRYRLLETIRQYAQERLAAIEEGQMLRDRHLEYFMATAEQAETQLGGSAQAMWLERLEAEHDNLRAALEWSLNAGKREKGKGEREEERADFSSLKSQVSGLALAGALSRFWYLRGYWSEGRAYLGEALRREEPAGSTQRRVKALNGAGVLARYQGDYGAARALHEENLAIARELGNKQGIAASLHNLGSLAEDMGDYEAAKALYHESLAIRRELGDKQGIAALLGNLGSVANAQGDYKAARALYEEALTINREIGNRVSEAYNLTCLGIVVRNQGNYKTCKAFYKQSLALGRELGDKYGIAGVLYNLGAVAGDQGDYKAARALYEEALAINREIGNRAWEAINLIGLGNVACSQGNFGTAKAFYEQSLSIRHELGIKQGIAESLEAFARLMQVENKPQHAARLWAAAEALRQAIGSPLPPADQEEHEREVAVVRESLGEEAFAVAWAEGRAMTLEQAVEYALHEKAG